MSSLLPSIVGVTISGKSVCAPPPKTMVATPAIFCTTIWKSRVSLPAGPWLDETRRIWTETTWLLPIGRLWVVGADGVWAGVMVGVYQVTTLGTKSVGEALP